MKRSTRSGGAAHQLIGETVGLASVVSPAIAVVIGVVLFAVFYWGLPALEHSIASSGPVAGQVIAARITRLSKWLAWALLIVCLVMAAIRYFTTWKISHRDEKEVSWLSRLLARWVD